ncbi:hypothetical protein PVAP13_7NG132017 [Panicum virgatum]|uniref:Uncharacterized protein n=1 Tax=Panicum virgatum TaxID=38727 RepID=A0A8T0PTC4_PANVG|nr:hypothetical protein PVAP13_7NG132017 [Panicum virgatum]
MHSLFLISVSSISFSPTCHLSSPTSLPCSAGKRWHLPSPPLPRSHLPSPSLYRGDLWTFADFHFILAFAINYAANASAFLCPTNGGFLVYWDEANPMTAATSASCSASAVTPSVVLSLSVDAWAAAHGGDSTGCGARWLSIGRDARLQRWLGMGERSVDQHGEPERVAALAIFFVFYSMCRDGWRRDTPLKIYL